jgi:hypothetical protein
MAGADIKNDLEPGFSLARDRRQPDFDVSGRRT